MVQKLKKIHNLGYCSFLSTQINLGGQANNMWHRKVITQVDSNFQDGVNIFQVKIIFPTETLKCLDIQMQLNALINVYKTHASDKNGLSWFEYIRITVNLFHKSSEFQASKLNGLGSNHRNVNMFVHGINPTVQLNLKAMQFLEKELYEQSTSKRLKGRLANCSHGCGNVVYKLSFPSKRKVTTITI
jgi:hypothetical protein